VAPALIFLLTYLVVALGRLPLLRIDRTGAAVIGAILMVTLGGSSLDAAYHAVDYRTLLLLFGMMVIVSHLTRAGVFHALARWTVRSVDGPTALVTVIVFASGLLAAFFVNDTICLVFTPVMLELATAHRMSPVPLLVALATGANIGGVATMTGNPQNMLIGSVSRIGYAPFLAHLAPVALIGLALDVVVIRLVFRRLLVPASARAEAGDADGPGPAALDRGQTIKSLIVAAGVLAGFLVGYEPALVALGGAAVLLVTRRVNPREVYSDIDWGLLMLFAGLFVVVGGVEQAGLDRQIFAWLEPIGITTVTGLSVAAAVLSNLVSNVPAVMLFVPIVPDLPDPRTAWLTLAMASTLAGNLTIVGSIANLIVAEGAARQGVRLSFADYLRVGIPITLSTIAVGILWLSL
jgi:Na+/H+ antiporter NhaD/arsenite permease-like protein